MQKKNKGLSDHPSDRKFLERVEISDQNSEDSQGQEDNPPFLEFDNNDFVTINYFDHSVNSYVSARTKLSKNQALALSDSELHQLAHELLTKSERQAFAKYDIKTIEIPQKRSYIIEGNSSIKKIDVGIYATQADDEIALHYLLSKTRALL